MVGWVGRVVGIQLAAIVGTIAIVLVVARLLPFGSLTSVLLGTVLSGGVFFWAAYMWIDWDTVSSSFELGAGSERPGD